MIQERELLTSDIVITNGQTPIALAGVMGGDFFEVKEHTSNIVIEGAILIQFQFVIHQDV